MRGHVRKFGGSNRTTFFENKTKLNIIRENWGSRQERTYDIILISFGKILRIFNFLT